MPDQPHALVIGASSGIGEALGHSLLADHRVSVIARRADRLAALVDAGASAFPGDVADLESIAGLMAAAVARNGPIDALIYCAGTQLVKPLRSTSPVDLQRVFTVNLIAPAVIATQFASRRVSSEHATFCVVASVAGQRPEPGIVAYGAAKAGLINLVGGMARELGPRRVVGVAPGWIDTEMTQAYRHLYNDAFREQLAKNSPAGPASIGAVVDTIRFLLSPAAHAITGEIVRVDGGAAI